RGPRHCVQPALELVGLAQSRAQVRQPAFGSTVLGFADADRPSALSDPCRFAAVPLCKGDKRNFLPLKRESREAAGGQSGTNFSQPTYFIAIPCGRAGPVRNA